MFAGDRTGPRDPPSARRDRQARVIVPGQLGPGLATLGLVAQQQAADQRLVDDLAANRLGRPRIKLCIVIAGDPQPLRHPGQRGEHPGGVGLQPCGPGAVMEIIAQRIDPSRSGLAHRQGDSLKRFAAVIGRQHLAVTGKKAGFLQMQVGHQQRLLTRPIQRAGLHQPHFLTSEQKGNHNPHLPQPQAFGKPHAMTEWTAQTAQARAWFEQLRDRICTAFEAIEHECGSAARFTYTPWQREGDGGARGETGGGVRGVMKGQVFEKVGVNVSTVVGALDPGFAATINGASEQNNSFSATGISLVAHMANPHVPAVHMNLRFLTTTKAWFGGGADLNPPLPYAQDTAEFHAALKQACDAHGADYYARYSKWAEEYFQIPHRQCQRGVGGIFCDHLECADAVQWDANFAFLQAVGEAFLDVFPKLVRRRMGMAWTPADKLQQLEWRGRYAEFNLVYDRGTLFGLKTGGNIDAILMSLPPEAVWS